MNTVTLRLIGTLVLLAFLWGCQSDVSMSRAVRVGDTITVSLGNADPSDNLPNSWTKANITKSLPKKDDITAFIASDANPSATYDVNLRYLFRTFADPTGLAPAFRGKAMWMAVVDLAHPVSGVEVPLSPGLATLTFQSNDFSADHTVKVDILSGSGSPHEFLSKQVPSEDDKFLLIEPAKQALVGVTGTLPSGTMLGAAKYVFDIPDVDDTTNPFVTYTAVAPARFPTLEQVNFRIVKETSVLYGANGTLVSVYLTAADGLSETQLNRFDFVMTSELDGVNTLPNYWVTHFQSSESAYYDTNGELITTAFLNESIGTIE